MQRLNFFEQPHRIQVHTSGSLPSLVFRRVIQALLVLACCLAAWPAKAVLSMEEKGYFVTNGPLPAQGSYFYSRKAGEAMVMARHQSPGLVIQGQGWVTDLMSPGTGEIFQLCVRSEHPANPQCPTGPWPGWGASYSYACTPTVNCVTIYNYSWRPQGQGCPINSTPTAQGCVCKPDFIEDAASNACTPAVLEPPPMCSRDSGMQFGNPIMPASQAKIRVENDWTGQGPPALSFTRTYRSSWGSDPDRAIGPLGKAWAHNHSISLVQSATFAGPAVSITTDEGYLRTFVQTPGVASWTRAESSDTLTALTDGGWSYGRAEDNATLTFDSTGKLLSLTARNGWATRYAYDTAGRLTSITDAFGQILSMAYNGTGQLVSVTAPGSQVIGYAYDIGDRLSTVTYPDNTTRSFLYENSSYPYALTAIVDEKGNRWGSFGYDTAGRAISTELAGGVERYQVSYSTVIGAAATVTDPLGTVRSYQYGTSQRKLAVTSMDKPDPLGKPDAAQRVQNAQGLIDSETAQVSCGSSRLADNWPARV
ncbi:DUF6531 domain-containing protein [Acidovorax sp. BLS4]|uniref:DUF6531 domain-containing protein n=1 Tax=Acidovorax sp. BLS4 TaxID=3273430 RepID=UPI00294375DE|nr:DUF6531 domain-containing protein [Paracidovorax avenae]WOI45555.1 DUF6531 domain-containing protein [Paracidovorax avenae]